tara:strand:- start:227 stop:352 length:126 start_codon:yes stop_codon:yes gene_type:complete
MNWSKFLYDIGIISIELDYSMNLPEIIKERFIKDILKNKGY